MEFKIKKDGKVASCLVVKAIKGYPFAYELVHVRTEPDFRKQGLANQLLEKAKQKYDLLVALPWADQDSELRGKDLDAWYKRHGFVHEWFPINGKCNGNKRCMVWDKSHAQKKGPQ